MFRSIAEKEYRSDIDKHKLGIGIVQIDESHFFKAKFNLFLYFLYFTKIE